MTNKPMLSVDRELIQRIADHCKFWIGHPYLEAIADVEVELRALLDKPVLESQYDGMTQAQAQDISDGVDEILHGKPAAQHQGYPEIPKHENCVTVLVLQEGEQTYSEAIYCEDGKFRFGYDEEAITDVEKWMPMPGREQPAPVAVVMPFKLEAVVRTSYSDGWNEALAEVARLNGVSA